MPKEQDRHATSSSGYDMLKPPEIVKRKTQKMMKQAKDYENQSRKLYEKSGKIPPSIEHLASASNGYDVSSQASA